MREIFSCLPVNQLAKQACHIRSRGGRTTTDFFKSESLDVKFPIIDFKFAEKGFMDCVDDPDSRKS